MSDEEWNDWLEEYGHILADDMLQPARIALNDIWELAFNEGYSCGANEAAGQ